MAAESDAASADDGSRGVGWSTIVTSDSPSAPPGRWGHSFSAITSSHVVVFGGTAGPLSFKDVHVFELATKRWASAECVGDVPSVRWGHSCNVIGDYELLVLGGREGSKPIPLDEYHILDLRTLRWTRHEIQKPAPKNRYSHGAIFRKRKRQVVIFGGHGGRSRYYSDVAILKLRRRPPPPKRKPVSARASVVTATTDSNGSTLQLPGATGTDHDEFHTRLREMFDDGKLADLRALADIELASGDEDDQAENDKVPEEQGASGRGAAAAGGAASGRGSAAAALETSWQFPQVSGSGPGKRSAHSMTRVGDVAFVYGGFNGRAILADMFMLDLRTLTWSELKLRGRPIPSLMGHSCIALVPRPSASAPAGYVPTTLDADQEMESDQSSDEEGDVPETATDGASTVLSAGSGTLRKRSKPSEHRARRSGRRGVLVLFGGALSPSSLATSAYVVDLRRRWSQPLRLERMPEPRFWHRSVRVGTSMLVFGGSSSNSTAFNDMYSLELAPLCPLACEGTTALIRHVATTSAASDSGRSGTSGQPATSIRMPVGVGGVGRMSGEANIVPPGYMRHPSNPHTIVPIPSGQAGTTQSQVTVVRGADGQLHYVTPAAQPAPPQPPGGISPAVVAELHRQWSAQEAIRNKAQQEQMEGLRRELAKLSADNHRLTVMLQQDMDRSRDHYLRPSVGQHGGLGGGLRVLGGFYPVGGAAIEHSGAAAGLGVIGGGHDLGLQLGQPQHGGPVVSMGLGLPPS